MVLDIGIGHVFAWGLMLLCIIILLVQIIPFVIDLFRVFIDWWDFQLGSLDKESPTVVFIFGLRAVLYPF
ncbi:MAG: hypothetical protein EBT41_00245 [Betaproteobacteria bacterium]|nr:hypothetical protein [Betaproteobacteria bacterium]